MVNFNLSGKVALVTGVSYGIGFAIGHILYVDGGILAYIGKQPAGE